MGAILPARDYPLRPARKITTQAIIDIYILLDVLLCSIAEYFYEFWRARRASENTNE